MGLLINREFASIDTRSFRFTRIYCGILMDRELAVSIIMHHFSVRMSEQVTVSIDAI